MEASPGETLFVYVLKLNEGVVIVPGSLTLRFDIDLSGGHANNFLVQKVARLLVNKLVVKFAGTDRISLDHQILTDHGVFYPYALENYLVFKLTLAPASQVVKGNQHPARVRAYAQREACKRGNEPLRRRHGVRL